MKMQPLRVAAASALLFAGAALAGQVVIYKQPNFAGESRTFNGEDTNLADNGINDQASSIVVRSGRWQFCSQPNYQGDCQVLDPGEYATLPQSLNHRIESFREVTRLAGFEDRRSADRRDTDRRYGNDRRGDERWDGRDRDARGDMYAQRGRWSPGSVEFFEAQGFRGLGLLVERDSATLGYAGERISSMIVYEGVWEVCVGERYAGPCRTFEPGRYPTLGRLAGRVSSVRRVG